jgi:hypothetical protein
MLWRRGKAYSEYLHEQVFAAAEAGLRVARSRINCWSAKVLGRHWRTGERTAAVSCCAQAGPPSRRVREHASTDPDITPLPELQTWLRDEHKMSAGLLCKTVDQPRPGPA